MFYHLDLYVIVCKLVLIMQVYSIAPTMLRIHMFLSLVDLNPDPLVRGMDPGPDPDPSITKAKIVRKTLLSTAL